MAKSKESFYKEKVLAVLNRIPGCKFINTPTGGRFNAGRGFPDVLGSWDGKLVFIEFKHGGNQLSPAQITFLEKWKDAAICCLFRSFDDGSWAFSVRGDSQVFTGYLCAALPVNLGDIHV